MSDEKSFRRRVKEIERSSLRLWHAADDAFPEVGAKISRASQWTKERAARRLVDFLATELAGYPVAKKAQEDWRENVRIRIAQFGEAHLDWPSGHGDLFAADPFLEATRDFVHRARDFAPDIDATSMGQGLRNVWIANTLQMLFGIEVECTPAIFAYSMLYPWTDNYLDNPEVPFSAKREFNLKLGRRLAGERPLASSDHENSAFSLIDLIEEHWQGHHRQPVFASLMAIHRAQASSLRQQEGRVLDQESVLALSISKGGASVLADGFLVAGSLNAAEMEFCFGFGVVLQLLDDLQDALVDNEAEHATLFSNGVGEKPLDRPASRLYSFMHSVVHSAQCPSAADEEALKSLILGNCVFLMVAAVAKTPRLFSRPYRRHLERRWPLRLAAMRRLEGRAEARFPAAAQRLCRRRSVATWLDLL